MRDPVAKRAPAAAPSRAPEEEEAEEEDLPDLPDEDEEEEEGPERGGVRRTRNARLQAKLDQLAALGEAGRVRDFCALFLPLDLSAEEAEEFTAGLEADGERWAQIAGELALLASGVGVRRIVGDQKRRAEFRYGMVGKPHIGREVVFVCTDGDWRAEG